MFDIAWSEILLIGVLVLLVMGPSELPKMMRSIGRVMGKARSFSRQFKAGLDDIARETELDEIRRKANQAQTLRPDALLASAIDEDGEIRESLSGQVKSEDGASPTNDGRKSAQDGKAS